MSRFEINLPIITLLIIAVGFITLSSAAPNKEVFRQLIFLGVAILGCFIVLWLGQRRIRRFSLYTYYITIALLILNHFFGTVVNGAKSWLYLKPIPIGFQPSELAKIALILALAAIFHEKPIRNFLHYIKPFFLVAIPCILVLLQPDLGSALVIAAIGGGVILVRGIPRWHMLFFLLVILIAIPTIVWPNLKPHQQERIVAFMNPDAYPKDGGYQVIQSRIAIGSGGMLGKGYKQGTQGQLGFIPYQHTDFIYSVLAEEGGFVAAIGLLVLYGLLFWRLTVISAECPKEHNQLVIAGVLSFIGFQVIVNIGVTLGLAPVTGITLPLVSYGGTSLLSTILALTLAYIAHRDRYEEW